MRVAYYPGCTLKLKAQGLEQPALAALAALGVEALELERWNCCGAVPSLPADDLLHQVAPVRNLIRGRDAGASELLTLCAPCYNTLARANLLMREEEEKRRTLNLFMEEERDYAGELRVRHLLDFLRDVVGFDAVRARVTRPLAGMRIAPYYGCTLLRPKNVAIEDRATLLHRLIEALGGTPVDFGAMTDCCGSFQILGHEPAALDASAAILAAARAAGADAVVSSCPLCEYNLGTRQADLRARHPELGELPTYYFTQLLAIALGLDPGVCRLEQSPPVCRAMLAERGLLERQA